MLDETTEVEVKLAQCSFLPSFLGFGLSLIYLFQHGADSRP